MEGFEKSAMYVIRADQNDTFNCHGQDNAGLLIADVDNDGHNDIIVAGSSTGFGIPVYDNNGNRTFTEVDLNLPNIGEGGQAMADFNNDCKLDLIFAGAAIPWHTNGENWIDQNDGSTLITEVYRNQTAAIEEPIIEINRTRLNFGADSSGLTTGAQTFSISNSGSGTLNGSVSVDSDWLNCFPASGTNFGKITVSIDVSSLVTGTYKGTITITSTNATNSPQTLSVKLNVYKTGGGSQPFGNFETPIDGVTGVSGSISVSGWALDNIEVTTVKIYRGPTQGEDIEPVYIGDAVFVEGARPDVELSFPDHPFNYRAGWGYLLLTNFLPNGGNGTYTLYAKVIDKEGNVVTLGTKTISFDNANAVKPFGAIDTPTQGGTASGNRFVNWGWVLTPQPNRIPTDGSTIDVWVDGVNIGHPTYNIYRSDIAALFPGYANSNGAVGYFILDTIAYQNGVHTIQWKAADDAGNTDGIGSRYFVIQNNSQNQGRRNRKPNRGTGLANL